MLNSVGISHRCIWCDSYFREGTKKCPVCGLEQEVKIPESRTGPCQCSHINNNKMLVVSVADQTGRLVNYCIDCLSPAASQRMARYLLESGIYLTNQDISLKLEALAKGFGRKYNYTDVEKKEALVQALGVIFMAKERQNIDNRSE